MTETEHQQADEDPAPIKDSDAERVGDHETEPRDESPDGEDED